MSSWIVVRVSGSNSICCAFLRAADTMTAASIAQSAPTIANASDRGIASSSNQARANESIDRASSAAIAEPANQPAAGAFWPFFSAGNYEVFVQAPITGGAYTYKSPQTGTIPVLQVQAGVFAQSAAMGQQLVLQ